MASVHSPIRTFLKPILFKLFGNTFYPWFQYKAKVRDIELKLVEEKEMELLPLFLSANGEAIDIGANYAYYTVRLANLCKKVYAFEPIPFTYKVCAMVIKHYKLKNVLLYNKGIGEKNEWHKFTIPVTDFGAISAGQAHFGERNDNLEGREKHVKFNKTQEVDCEVIALDSLVDQFSNVQFIKIDIEGAEYFALKGMQKTIETFRPVILIEINPFFLKGFNLTEQQMADLIEELQYDIFVYDDTMKKLIKSRMPFEESNYILIDKNKLQHFQNYIDHEVQS
ncbi:MAG: FkbM family methyltransferase [Bacteroidota bacterium]|nr:FkbM family methyltransferase [Bacteroidota bacterium]